MLSIILLTYQRTDYAIRTVEAIHKNLEYGGVTEWIIADDGSHSSHVERVIESVKSNKLINPDNIRHFTKEQGYGAMANQAWHLALGNVTLWLADRDWETWLE